MRAGPLSCGYVFTVWSVARLGAYLRRRTGIRVGATRLRRLLDGEGFVLGRPAHTLRNKRDEAEYDRARRRLERLKRGR
jgi:transposase